MKTLQMLVLALGAFLVATMSAAVDQSQLWRNTYSVDLTMAAQDPCTGETFTLSGAMLFQDFVAIDARGTFHFHSEMVSQGMQGVGDTTGTKYHYVGAYVSTSNYVNAQNYTTTNEVHFISGGSGQNFTAIYTVHVTMNAQGEVTAERSSIRFECQ